MLIHDSNRLSFELRFPSELGFETVARDAVAAFARRAGFDQAQIDDLKTAISEACVNAIEHGNQQSPGLHVGVQCVSDDQRLFVEIDDVGLKRYQPCPPPADIDTKIRGAAPLRGMGLLLIRQLVDEAGFADTPSGGNRFWFTIYRRPSQPARLDIRVSIPTPACHQTAE